jgi:ABC-type transport system involved in multi-copper enzyme maturation permease subunit
MPTHFPRMVLAEIRKVFTRGSGLAALIIALLVGFGAVGVMWQIKSMGEGGPSFNGVPISQIVALSGVETAGKALTARNFFVLPLFLLLAAASSVGGEVGDRTLRELVVRPVSRWSVLAAKLVALSVLSAVSLVLTLVPSLGLGTAIFGLDATPAAGSAVAAATPSAVALLGGYAASFLSDVGLLTITMALSLVVTSIGGTIVAMALLLMADGALRALLWLLDKMGVESAGKLAPFMLGNALACWQGWKDGWNPAQFGILALFIAVSSAFAIARFHRMDVP